LFAAAAEWITTDSCQVVLRQHMNSCTYGRIICSPPANDLTPTSKNLILNTGEKAGRQQSCRRNRRFLNPVGLLIGSVLKEKAHAMSHANLAALSAAITK
jgi:hypothetical protein